MSAGLPGVCPEPRQRDPFSPKETPAISPAPTDAAIPDSPPTVQARRMTLLYQPRRRNDADRPRKTNKPWNSKGDLVAGQAKSSRTDGVALRNRHDVEVL